jgi:lipid-A-disaccharide synthase
MVVGYRLHGLSYWVARRLVRVPDVALVNLVAGRRVAPELVQGAFTADAVAAAAAPLLQGDWVQPAALEEVRERLGPPGASQRAAKAVLATATGSVR